MLDINTIQSDKKQRGEVISPMQDYGHENVLFCQDNQTGLKAIIAVHSTVLGPALGGTRMWAYQNENEALNDVLRLSRGMTYKNSLAGLNLGGGKAVIIGDPHRDKSAAQMRKFGAFVNRMGGSYITAEDVGITPQDMEYVHAQTDYVVGLPGKSGDPSPVTAQGVYMGMKAAAKEMFGTDSLANRKIAVQGVGHVGEHLVKALTKEGAILYVTDTYEPALKEITKKYKVIPIDPDLLYDLDMDIYAPCALGATLNDHTLDRLKCSIIAGAANNQLENEQKHGQKIMDKGIIYAPDYAINAGGVINCYAELKGLPSEWAFQKVNEIYSTITTIIQRTKKENTPSYQIANKMAEERIQSKQ